MRALSESLDGALATVRRMLAEGGLGVEGRMRARLDAAGAPHLAIVEETEAQAANLGVVKALLAFARPFATTLTNRMLHDATILRARRRRRATRGENLPWHLCVAPPVFEENRHLPGRIDAEELALAMASKAGAEVCDAGATVLEYGGYDVHAIVRRGGLHIPRRVKRPARR